MNAKLAKAREAHCRKRIRELEQAIRHADAVLYGQLLGALDVDDEADAERISRARYELQGIRPYWYEKPGRKSRTGSEK